jgi:hypothetical protein
VSYTILQNTEQSKLAISFQRKCDIDAIRLVEITAYSKFVFKAESNPFSFSVDFGPDSSILEGRTLRANTRYKVRILDREKNDIVTIKCVIAADYLLEDGFVPSAEQIKAFQEGPAIHNCWPYFRECAQAVISRMNYPPLTLPFLWMAPAQPQSGKAAKRVSATRSVRVARARQTPAELTPKPTERD